MKLNRQITVKKKEFNLNPFDKMQAKKDAKQKEIDRQNELKRLELERKKEKERLVLVKAEKKKQNIIKILVGLLILIPSIILWPILLPASLVAFWYFTKKNPNEKIKKHTKNLTMM